MKFSSRRVATLLGHLDSTVLAQYEHGKRLPSLKNVLRLSVILRVPVEFLYPVLYDSLRRQIRAEEERLDRPSQQPLF
jgi:transcriptional regulator with XRE-family HTH domain